MVKQEMARVNVNILGISKLTWTGVGEFNSDDHCNALTTNAEEAEVEWFCEDLQDLLELTPPKDFIIGDWNAKVGSQGTPGVTGKFGLEIRNEAGQRLRVLPRECTGHNKHSLPTVQEKTLHMDITRCSTLKSD